MGTIQVVLIIVGANVILWMLIFAGFRHEQARIRETMWRSLRDTGESLILGPQNGYYASTRGRWKVSSMGVMALTNERLIFRILFGKGFDIPIQDVAGVSYAKWFQGMYRNGREFLILKLNDGSEAGFQTNDERRWGEEITNRIETRDERMANG